MKTCNDCKWRRECIGASPDGKWMACGQFEEKTGKWLKGNMPTYGGYKCSICGGNSISKFSYCPNCGARMVE